MTDRYVVFKITSGYIRSQILDWAQRHKNNGQPALLLVSKKFLTIVCQEAAGYANDFYYVEWFVECSGLTSMFLNIRDWGLTESTDTMLFGRYNLDTTLEFIGAPDSLPGYKQWLAGHSEVDILRQHKLNLEPEEKTTSTKSDDTNIMAENTQLKLENDKLRLLAEQLDKDRVKLRADLDELRQDLDRVKEECWRYKRFHDAGL